MRRKTEASGERRDAGPGARRTGALLVVAAATLWSTGGVGVKTADAEPLVIAGLRTAFALAFMGAVLVVTVRRSGRAREVARLVRRPLVWAAAASYALMVVCFVLAARKTTAANAIFLQYTAPVYVALLSGPMLGEKIDRRDLFAVGACLAGMALTFGGELGGGRTVGNLLAIASSFGFAGLPLFLRLDQRRLEANGQAAAAHAPLVAMVMGNAIATLIALPAVVRHPPEGPLAAQTWAVLIALGFFQIGLPYVLYAVAVRRLRALESSLLATVEPVLTPVWVFFVNGESPSALALAGGALIVLAVMAQAISRAHKA